MTSAVAKFCVESGEQSEGVATDDTSTNATTLINTIETHHIEPVEEQSTIGLIGNVTFNDIVKIFVDSTEIAELSADQVKRIRESNCIAKNNACRCDDGRQSLSQNYR